MHRARTPLHVWFWGAYLVSTQTPGMSALQLQRQLGLGRYETAFQMLHKLRTCMVRPDRDRIGGPLWPVEVDECLVGGATRGEGRGVHHKAIVVGAVEVRQRSKPIGRRRKRRTFAGRLRLRLVRDRGKAALERFVTESVAPATQITADGWQGYALLQSLGYEHGGLKLGGIPENVDVVLPMIHLVFSNLKAWLDGTHHGVSAKHLPAYLDEFVFRFNRRFHPMTSFQSVLGLGALARGPTYETVYARPGRRRRPRAAAR